MSQFIKMLNLTNISVKKTPKGIISTVCSETCGECDYIEQKKKEGSNK